MTRFVDLSHIVEDGTITYPGLPGPVISDHLTREQSREHYAPGVEFHIGSIEMVANTGTYIDVPFHRFEDGFGLDELPLPGIAGVPGVCLPIGDGAVRAGHLADVDFEGRAVLIATGWSRHWATGEYGAPEHPYVAEDAAQALVDGRATVVGIDSVNIDDTRGGHRPAHSLLLAAGIPIVEHLTGLDALVGASFRFFAVPAKVRGLGSWPVRAFATFD